MSSRLQLDSAYCQFLRAHPCGGILIALSGGADSVALLHVARQHQAEFGYRLEALHVHHGIRGTEADRDRDFCISLCQELNVPLHVVQYDIPALAEIDKTGLEETARNYRYRALQEFATAQGLDVIATAHTATDNLETVLLQLARGCGSVIGIPPVRDAYVRPLLSATRADVLQYLDAWKLPHVEDSSNDSTDYNRNLIRHQVLPVLLQINPQAEAAFGRATELSRSDNLYLEELASNAAINGKVEELAALPMPLRSRALKTRCETLGAHELSHTHLQALSRLVERGVPHSALSLPGCSVSIENGSLVRSPAQIEQDDWEVVLHPGENHLPDGSLLYLSTENEEMLKKYISRQQNIYKLLTKIEIDFATIEGTIIARPRKAGDRILSGGMHRSVKKLYCDHRVPLEIRNTAPLICNDTEILWIPTIKMISDRVSSPCDSPVHLIWFRKGTDYETL